MKTRTLLLTSALLLTAIAFLPGASADPNECDGTIEENCWDNYRCKYRYNGECVGWTGTKCAYYVAGVCVQDVRYILDLGA